MGSGEAESCCSSGPEQSGSAQPKQSRLKLDIYTKVLQRVRDSDLARNPGFEDELWAHFNRLPARYSIDFNLERAEDVFMHMKLLQLSEDPENRPVFHIRVVQAPVIDDGNSGEEPDQLSKRRVHPPPMFGSSCNLEALASESNDSQFQDGDSISHGTLWAPRPMHEITFSSDDKPKLLSQLTSLLADLNLNIQEAHAFSTNDGHSLDVFLVSGWRYEETEQLEQELRKEIQQIKAQSSVKPPSLCPFVEQVQNADKSLANHVQIPTDGSDVWEIDFKLLKCESKVASGTYGDLYKGTYCSQDVAIKVLKPERVNSETQREFRQEVFIMRKIRHKNVVQFIGACTKPPIFCIITEYMSGGSLYDVLHKRKESFKLPILLRIAIDVSKGMSYLHQNYIIHRDLKTANLLMDENQVVKVADFGVARVKSPSGVMTAETGTYRWMAPEVIEHKRYDHKADIFSFGIVLWELLTGQIPYERYTPLQAAVGVVQKGLRPTIPKNTNPKLAKLLEECWQQDPCQRPDFTAILLTLHNLAKEVKDVPEKTSGKILSKFGFGSK